MVKGSFELFELLEKKEVKDLEILDPQPDAIPKLRDQFRYTIILKSKSLEDMHQAIKQTIKEFKRRNVIVTVNVDP